MGDKSPEHVGEVIEDVKARIVLLEGDRKAYYESSQWNMKENRERIARMRKENDELRRKLRDSLAADDHVINDAFHNKPVVRASMKNKTGEQAIDRMDGLLSDHERRLNSLRHLRDKREKRLADLKLLHEQMLKDAACIADEDLTESEETERQRGVENRLDKAIMKLQEAEHICRTYLQIRSKLEEESKNYPNKINNLESEIKRTKAKVEELRQVQNDAVSSKEGSQRELRKHEEQIYADKKRRDLDLQQLRREAEERRLQQERMDRRANRHDGAFGDQLDLGTDVKRNEETDREKSTTYEDAFQKIKEATGVADMREVVQRFLGQGETRHHLEDLKNENEKQISRLKEDKQRLQQEYEQKKYTGEAKLSQGERMLEQFRSFVQTQEDLLKETDTRLQRNTQILGDMRTGVEHLHDKLQHIKTAKAGIAGTKINPTSDEYVLDLLSVCEEKLIKLMDDLVSENEQDLRKLMIEEDFHTALEGKLPLYNTRIRLVDYKKDQLYAEDDDDQDDAGAEANELIEAKTKRKQNQAPKKKKKK